MIHLWQTDAGGRKEKKRIKEKDTQIDENVNE